MVRDQLETEINKYLGLPYFINSGKYRTIGDNAYVGKGSAHDIALATIDLANRQNLKLLDLTTAQIYHFQKKNHLGLDCSGLACHLLNFYFGTHLDVRKTSAAMLTSTPLSQKIASSQLTTGDLVRQKSGRHVLFIIKKSADTIFYVDSSAKGRGVRLGQFSLTDQKFKYDGFFRLFLFH